MGAELGGMFLFYIHFPSFTASVNWAFYYPFSFILYVQKSLIQHKMQYGKSNISLSVHEIYVVTLLFAAYTL